MGFRQSFQLVNKHAVRWFPGHMGRGLKQIQQKLRNVDCIIEVHDARVPFSGRNPEFKKSLCGLKPHILVLNKKDLCDIHEQRRLTQHLHDVEGQEHVVFTNCKNQRCSGIRKLIPLAHDLITSSNRYNRSAEADHCLLIVGVPNVGKSSLLNVLRNLNLKKKGATQVGAIAGVTRSVLTKIKISEDPLMYMIDTPGILEPCIADDEMGMKLALVGCLPDHLVGELLIADYLLYCLNKRKNFSYVPTMGLEEPVDEISEALVACANKLGVTRKVRQPSGHYNQMPDVYIAAKHFIREFRKGALGFINLDSEQLTAEFKTSSQNAFIS